MKNEKTKRIKRVFGSSDQVLHLWANQSQSDARSKNVFFEGKSCFSYGRHYKLGRLVEFNGVTVALINDTGYSKTTQKHIRRAHDACAHLPRLMVKGFEFGDKRDVVKGLIRLQDELVGELMAHFSKRSPWRKFEKRGYYSWGERLGEFNETCKKLGFEKLMIQPSEDFIKLFNAHYELAKKRREFLKTPEQIALANERAKKRAADAVKTWRNGGAKSDAVRNLYPQLIRVRGDQVETSRGASVPLDHALRLLRLYESGKAKTGERIGHFTFNAALIDRNLGPNEIVLKIGCHTIALSEARAVLGALAPKLELVK